MSDDYPVPRKGCGMTARWITADVFDGLAQLDDGSVDLVVTSPPFLALRSYLPADHPDKGKEIGSEATPAEYLDTLLAVTAELRRVLAPHGSICVELGDTYAGSAVAGNREYGDSEVPFDPERYDKPMSRKFSGYKGAKSGSGGLTRYNDDRGNPDGMRDPTFSGANTLTGGGPGWPLAKSRTLIPQLYEIALAYGVNPLTGQPSPAGQWRIRNVVTWARPNPPVGALGDKWRPATSDLIVACTSSKRYWDDLATRRPHKQEAHPQAPRPSHNPSHGWDELPSNGLVNTAGAPLLDYWEIPPGGYRGAHYAVFPPALVEPLVKAMCPQKVCRTCGEPSRRIVETTNARPHVGEWHDTSERRANYDETNRWRRETGDTSSRIETLGWTDCGHGSTCPKCKGDGKQAPDYDETFVRGGICPICDGRGTLHDSYRPGLVLDPFAGSGTTLAVATGHGHDAIGIDLDERNLELARERVGPFFFEEVSQ